MKLRLLFLGYWNLDDGLTQSTIMPHLNILKNIEKVDYLHFSNIQREIPTSISTKKVNEMKIPYTPLYSKNLAINHFNKIYDFIYFPELIRRLCVQHNITLIISRGAPAGALAYLATKKNKIPFIVESFEPHADYMKSSGEWTKLGLKYFFQKHWENKQKKHAKNLITVAENYRNRLIDEGINEEKIFTVPCAVDQKEFFKSDSIRKQKRRELNISNDATVGVYAGKFGGLYLEESAFKIFHEAFEQIANFNLLLLTNTDSTWLNKIIDKYELPTDRIHLKFVNYHEVNDYLNVADFAFALYKTHSVSQYLSPVKIGEYWACGLPVYITPNLGDEMHWIKQKQLGAIINLNRKVRFKNIENFNSSLIIQKGTEIRSLEKVSKVYKQILN